MYDSQVMKDYKSQRDKTMLVTKDEQLTEEVIDNTIATQENTLATTQSNQGSNGVSKITATVAGLLLAAVCYVSYINPTFAENQAGIILVLLLVAVAGGLFGVATTSKR